MNRRKKGNSGNSFGAQPAERGRSVGSAKEAAGDPNPFGCPNTFTGRNFSASEGTVPMVSDFVL